MLLSVLVNPQMSKALARANRWSAFLCGSRHSVDPLRFVSVAAHTMLAEDPLCVRDWRKDCPDGWSSVGKSVCQAPFSYRGVVDERRAAFFA